MGVGEKITQVHSPMGHNIDIAMLDQIAKNMKTKNNPTCSGGDFADDVKELEKLTLFTASATKSIFGYVEQKEFPIR